MKYRLTRIFGFILLCCLYPGGRVIAQTQTSPLSAEIERKMAFQSEISSQYMRHQLEFIASDSMKGRNTGSLELRQISQYLADQYQNMGLEPAVGDTAYLQPYEIKTAITDSISLSISNKKTSGFHAQMIAKSDVPAPFIQLFGGHSSLQGEIIFAGFGINDRENNISHLGTMDLQNKWVMVYADIPSVVDGDTLINPALTARTRFQDIIYRKKAKGVIVIGLTRTSLSNVRTSNLAILGFQPK